jgi:hypothetical protein
LPISKGLQNESNATSLAPKKCSGTISVPKFNLKNKQLKKREKNFLGRMKTLLSFQDAPRPKKHQDSIRDMQQRHITAITAKK